MNKAREIQKACKDYNRHTLRDICDWIGFDVTKVEYPNRKTTYVKLLTDYYLDTNSRHVDSDGIPILKKEQFKHITFYYCRKRLDDYLDTLPYNF